MGWKATGRPVVRRQREKFVVRVDGIDTGTGKHRPRQLGTFPSQRSAERAAREFRVEDVVVDRGTVGWLVRRWVESRTDISVKAREGSSTMGFRLRTIGQTIQTSGTTWHVMRPGTRSDSCIPIKLTIFLRTAMRIFSA